MVGSGDESKERDGVSGGERGGKEGEGWSEWCGAGRKGRGDCVCVYIRMYICVDTCDTLCMWSSS